MLVTHQGMFVCLFISVYFVFYFEINWAVNGVRFVDFWGQFLEGEIILWNVSNMVIFASI